MLSNTNKLEEKGFYQKAVLHFTDKSYNLTPNLTRSQRQEIFKLLDSTTYYNFIRHNIFEIKAREQGYFTFDTKTYQDFKGIFAYLRTNDFQVGLAANTQWIHPFFMFGRDKFGEKFKINYVRYPQDLQYCYNAREPYIYTALITDDRTLIDKFASKVVSSKKFDNFYVLLFQNPEKDVFLQ